MTIKEILDKYDVRYGDVFYVKKIDAYFMITTETDLYGNPYIISLNNGIGRIYSWAKTGREAILYFFW